MITRSMRRALVLLVLLLACKKDEPKLSPAQCTQINDHLVDLAVKEVLAEKPADGVGDPITADALKKELAKDPRNANVAAGCEQSYTRATFDCMMAATTTKAAEACQPQN